MLRSIRRRLTYANVIATLALFFALGGGAVMAATNDGGSHKKASHKQSSGTIGAGKLKANSVTTTKIKAGAVTKGKIAVGAVNREQIGDGSVDFSKLAGGTNVVAEATSLGTSVSEPNTVEVAFQHPVSFTPTPGTIYLLSVEAASTNLAKANDEEGCRVLVQPTVNSNEWGGGLLLKSAQPTDDFKSGLIPEAGMTGPVGMAANGQIQTVGTKVYGSKGCSTSSQVTVTVVLTQLK